MGRAGLGVGLKFRNAGQVCASPTRFLIQDGVYDAFLDAFVTDAVAANGLAYVGGDDYGFICLDNRGSINEEQRASVEAWLKSRSELAEFTLSPLMDVWYPENPINPA